jgi:hypothetical protein
MPQRRKDFADRIDYRKQAPPPRAQDPLSAMAPLLRVRPEFQAVCRFASQWDARMMPSRRAGRSSTS